MKILVICIIFRSKLKNNRLRKSVIVTGASSGIGKYTAVKLLESGYQVFGLARRYDKLAAILSSESRTIRYQSRMQYRFN